jgi:recombination protein RecT
MELNPFNKEVWCYKDNRGNLLIFAGRDGFLSKAQKNPLFNGIRSMEVCKNDEFTMDVANNKIVHNPSFKNRGEIIGAYCIVFRKGGEPTIEWSDATVYDKKRNTWNTHKAEMMKKVAECHALKKAFGISGIQSQYDFEIKDGIAVQNKPENRHSAVAEIMEEGVQND